MFAKWVPACNENVICFYDDNHTTRAQGLALNARTSKSNKKERKSIKKTQGALPVVFSREDPASRARTATERKQQVLHALCLLFLDLFLACSSLRTQHKRAAPCTPLANNTQYVKKENEIEQ